MDTQKKLLSLLLVAVFALVPLGSALAQADYYFSVEKERVDAYWEEDGTLRLEYEILFHNGDGAHEIDVVDLGLPNNTYDTDNIEATLNGVQYSYMDEQSEYLEAGPAIYFSNPIPPGGTGTFRATVPGIREVLYTDNLDAELASALFTPNWFGSEFVFGSSDITIVYHLPPGVQPDEPKWHTAGHPGFPDEPVTGTDRAGRITYTWRNQAASISQDYLFGASFPKTYVPASAITEPNFFQRWGIDPEFFIPFLFCCCFILFIVGVIWLSLIADKKRRMQYLPPKIAIEGHGIKRGLTAPEAAILLEQPMDKILSMILFSAIKKGAAQVANREPLDLAVAAPAPKDLREYESQFLVAFKEGDKGGRRRALQTLMVDLVKGVATKMRGFSKGETLAYYKTITEDAWKQVEGADTPKVMSKLYDENLEWTMLDEDYQGRTTTVFSGRPLVYAPRWWGAYTGAGTGAGGTSTPSRTTGSSRVTLPSLPGADFAASMVKGTQSMASSVVGNLSDFTGGVTKVTNPPPPPSASRGGGFSGGGSSCACACAGCACACAGGGR